MIRGLALLLVQLVVVAASVFAADVLQRSIEFIPDWIVHLPAVDYSRADFWTVFTYFIACHAVVLGTTQLLRGPWRPGDARRTVDELFALAVAFAASSLLVFVTTTVAFDPQFVVGIAVCAAVATLVIHVGTRLLNRVGPARLAGDFGIALVRRVFSIAGILILLFALSPGILAKLFVSDRDVANFITRIRIAIATETSGDWQFVNAFGSHTFTQPLLVQFPPDDNSFAYILERGGRLVRMPWGGPGEPKAVLDISDRVGTVEVENGALGFDFHPQYGREESTANDDIYLYYTSFLDGEQVNYLSRFSLTSDDPNENAASEEVLISWDRNESGFHNGGSIEFGPDGFLYVAAGEMSANDSHQRLDGALIGGILRIDVDRRGGSISEPISTQPEDGSTGGYYIPLDNPFVDVPDALGEYWALGLRNPFRVSFDPATGNLWAGDVGSTVWEEVNLIRKGHNYQYPFVEGYEETGKDRPENVPGIEESGPIYTYRHTAYDRAVIGGVVYRGDRHPSLRGQYIFGDNYSGKIFTLPATGDRIESVDQIAQAPQFAQRGLSSFAATPDGKVLITTLGKSTEATGRVLELVPAGEAGTGEVSGSTESPTTQTVTAAQARSLYQENCSRCHGADGAGDGPDAEQMNVTMPDMRTEAFQENRSDHHLHAVIAEGGSAQGLSPMMPPWDRVLTDAEIDALVQYIRDLPDA